MMASLSPVANLGSVNMFSLGNYNGSFCLGTRFFFPGDGIRSKSSWKCKHLRYIGVCRYSVPANYVEKGNPLSHNSTYRGSSNSSSSRSSSSSSTNRVDDMDKFIRVAQKPLLKSRSKADPLLDMPWGESKLNGSFENGTLSDNREDEKSKVIESLGDILEKAEKLETSKEVNGPLNSNKHSVNQMASENNGQAINSVGRLRRRKKTMKSVWRKGNPVAIIQKVVKEPLRQEPSSAIQPHQPPQKVEPKLQSRPSLASPPSNKKPVVLKDANHPPVASKSDLAEVKIERKPILVDKFASKKPVADFSAPPKPGKGPILRSKNEFRKKGGPSEGPRRRLYDDNNDACVEDTSEVRRKGRKWSKASRKAARLRAAREAAPVRVEIMEVDEEGMLTDELAHNLAVSEGEILGYLDSMRIRLDGVQKLSKDIVKMVCREYEVEVIDAVPLRVEDMAKKKKILDEEDLDKLEERPPVLTIMGHVDHGKTTLLDYLRKSKVAAGEAGGITQGIGAYKVQVPIDGKKQTCIFLDTPGHEAFGAMRARGARVTDIAVIVVAADDGIRPQTNEAIAHAKAAGVPIIVAINKIDKNGANPDRVILDLSSIGLMPEEWGGDVPMVKISALKGDNVNDLLETIILLAELQELKANPNRNAKGTVIEAGLDKSKGPVATFIVQNGTLKRGDILVCGEAFGKVRALFDDNEKRVDEAGPSIPVQVIGLNNVPLAGDEFEVVGSLDIAREKAESQAEYLRNEHIAAKAGDGKVTLSSYASAISSRKTAGIDLHQLSIILKVNVQGSIEAVKRALQVLPQDNITLKFLLQATGDVNRSDVDLAVASKAIIFGFNAKISGSIKSYADSKNVEIRLYKVIYELIDDMRNAMEGLLDPVEERVPIGLAEVRAVFSSGSGRVAGCMVTEGKVVKDCGIRVIRKRKEVYAGILSSLRRVKEIVNEVNAGLECGIGIEDFNNWETGDIIETFNTVQKKRTLEEASASISATLQERGVQL
ncbi:translation initiation factor IF-2 [Striga asiatica]|uniref:Translation initiation factor IF-2, chloroplastic n=1 Tax=Striga asiatica TaxID=4170 RepID=A0A5A7R928_STRAF|nr:translation initiation factor IF-2 [Striga asiatica]